MDYTGLTVTGVESEFPAMARDAQSVFGSLNEQQLNWRRDGSRWSVAQCLDHLLNVNREMFRAIDTAMDPSQPRTLWQRLPVMPGFFGPLMIKSQAPQATRKFKAPAAGVPSSSEIDARIIERFVAHQHASAAHVRAFAARDVAGVVMVSPFASFVTYSVLDGCRLIVTHQRRHFEQARRVTAEPGFPAAHV